ncbi:MAG: hypothetical protein KBD01_14835 [Acidobacteria bacterium]|nr:hypothetical protein [Acidobacteriota bacterium]
MLAKCPHCGRAAMLNRTCSACGKRVDELLALASNADLRCPFCGGDALDGRRSMTTAGVVVLLAGILLAPVCIGVILIMIGLSMREQKYVCRNCGKSF